MSDVIVISCASLGAVLIVALLVALTILCCVGYNRWVSESHQRQVTNQGTATDSHQQVILRRMTSSPTHSESPQTTSLPPSLDPDYTSSTSCLSANLPAVMQHNSAACKVVNPGTIPKLECLIVPSFGSRPSCEVVEKKKCDFLRGVGKDLEIIQNLIERDLQKDLVRVKLRCPFEQVEVVNCIKMIEEKMKDLKLRDKSNSRNGREYILHVRLDLGYVLTTLYTF